jgi:hypothetical protein
MTAGQRLYTGAIVTPDFADLYAALTARIESFRAAGREAPENLLNGRHNALATFANS